MRRSVRKGHAAVRNAQLSLARERAVLEDQERQVVHDLSNAMAEVERSYQVAQIAYNRRMAARAQVAATKAGYESDRKVPLDLYLEAQRRVADADSEFFATLIEYALAVKNLHFEKGSLLDYNEIFLAEGPWPDKAYRDAQNIVTTRRQQRPMSYILQQTPPPISQGPVGHQNLPPVEVPQWGTGTAPPVPAPEMIPPGQPQTRAITQPPARIAAPDFTGRQPNSNPAAVAPGVRTAERAPTPAYVAPPQVFQAPAAVPQSVLVQPTLPQPAYVGPSTPNSAPKRQFEQATPSRVATVPSLRPAEPVVRSAPVAAAPQPSRSTIVPLVQTPPVQTSPVQTQPVQSPAVQSQPMQEAPPRIASRPTRLPPTQPSPTPTPLAPALHPSASNSQGGDARANGAFAPSPSSVPRPVESNRAPAAAPPAAPAAEPRSHVERWEVPGSPAANRVEAPHNANDPPLALIGGEGGTIFDSPPAREMAPTLTFKTPPSITPLPAVQATPVAAPEYSASTGSDQLHFVPQPSPADTTLRRLPAVGNSLYIAPDRGGAFVRPTTYSDPAPSYPSPNTGAQRPAPNAGAPIPADGTSIAWPATVAPGTVYQRSPSATEPAMRLQLPSGEPVAPAVDAREPQANVQSVPPTSAIQPLPPTSPLQYFPPTNPAIQRLPAVQQ